MKRYELLLLLAFSGFLTGYGIARVESAIEQPETAPYEFVCTTDEDCEDQYDHYLDIMEGLQR
jgi:hypothetical protein